MHPPEKLTQKIANAISDANGDGRSGVTLYALYTILQIGRGIESTTMKRPLINY